ncbi:DNA-directed RNA polymerase subunit omega [Alkaliphilus crotonatoxidans]
MLYPSIKDLMEQVDSRYTLVLAAAKRARQIIDGDQITVKSTSKKPVSIATQEIYEGKITYTRNMEEIRKEEAEYGNPR